MDINILGICGSPIKGGNTESLLNEALKHIQEKDGVNTELFTLADKKFDGCIHCNWCVKKQTEGKFCSQEDDLMALYPAMLKADGILMASPVHFGRLSGLMANMIDRMRAYVHGNLYRGSLRNKVGGALSVAFFRGGGIETTLATLNAMFFVFEMVIATSRMYQIGAGALTSTEGKGRTVKGVRHMALEDEFGVLSAQLLADRMVELAKLVKAGQEALKG
ncbi:MAG: flavodoxin family protein [Deltaproteobacteria bacterium]|nr:flavodoxin family protein [Deltaproteobacteria bacterium]MBW1817280.1 flavodoxin family protein [Deltaproteobacteria bacterium]MBW2284215.1 flavodoxin family protein [Deltaproteobacteria bacterium]